MIRDFFLGFIRIHILHHAALEPVYGVAIMAELRSHGYEISPGWLYPVLHGLQRSRHLRRVDRVVGGRVRAYYAITPQGRRALAVARKRIGELVREVLQEEPVARSGSRRKARAEDRSRRGAGGGRPSRTLRGTAGR